MRGDGFAEHGSVRGDEVDHAVRESGLLENLVDQVVGKDGGVAGLPHNTVTLESKKMHSNNALLPVLGLSCNHSLLRMIVIL